MSKACFVWMKYQETGVPVFSSSSSWECILCLRKVMIEFEGFAHGMWYKEVDLVRCSKVAHQKTHAEC